MKKKIIIILALSLLSKFTFAKKPKIAIVTLYDYKYKSIGSISDKNKLNYASKHDYDIFIYHNNLDESRHPAWSKILALQKHLKDYDWLFWTDADSLIMNSEIKLENLIDEKYDLLITKHALSNYLCTGSFLLKNSSWSENLLKLIYAQKQFIKADGWWEQGALLSLTKKSRSADNRIKYLPQRAMNSHIKEQGGIYQKGDFVIHFYSVPFVEKLKYMQNYANLAE